MSKSNKPYKFSNIPHSENTSDKSKLVGVADSDGEALFSLTNAEGLGA